MKRYFFSCLLLALSLLFLAACDSRKPVSSRAMRASVIAALEKGRAYTIESIKPELHKLLEFLKSNPHVITPEVLAKAAERHATISDLGLGERFPVEFPLEDGNKFEVYIELFDGSESVGNSIEDAEAYFTLDVDRYPEDAGVADPDDVSKFQAHVAATEHNVRKGLYRDLESRRELALESKVNYLLFFVGGEERLSAANEAARYYEWLQSRPDVLKAQASMDAEYWWITKITVLVDKDSGNDEFEMYYGPNGSDGTANPFNGTTGFVFDGLSHNDASGIARTFPDINGPSGTPYIPIHPIAIEPLTPDSPAGFKVCAIEDDCTATKHKNNGNGTMNFYLNVHDIDSDMKYNRQYTFTILDNCSNDDDIYGDSGTISFGSAPICRTSIPNGADVMICLRKGTIAQADRNWSDPINDPPCPAGTACTL